MELLDDDNETIKDMYRCLNRLSNHIDKIAQIDHNGRNKERFLGNVELARLLNVSLRTLQEWRNLGTIPFIQVRGKILYRKSDIDRVLQNNYYEERQD